MPNHQISVHLLPCLVDAERLRGGLVVVIDVLRASTTIVWALAAGCRSILPVSTIEQAREIAERYPPDQRLLIGERNGVRIDGFDQGNSPSEFVPALCADRVCIHTTTNGTGAILHALAAERVLIGAFVNFSAICEELCCSSLPIHLLCSGTNGQISLEDALLAGAFVEFLVEKSSAELDDSARLAWDAYEHHGQVLISALELSAGGQMLLELGLDTDLKSATDIDRFGLVPEVQRDPLRITASCVHLDSRLYPGQSGLFV